MRWIPALIIFGLFLSPASHADSRETYRIVEPPAPSDSRDKIEVVEFFWYGCPHCYKLEEDIATWVENKPEYVTFRQVPAPLNPRWTPHAHFFYAAELLGVLKQVHKPLFKALHEQRRRIMNKEELIRFAVDHGVDEQEFRKVWDSFPVNVKVQRASSLARRYKVSGVPALGVNGKYLTGTGMVKSHAQLIEVLNELVTAEAEAIQTVEKQTAAN